MKRRSKDNEAERGPNVAWQASSDEFIRSIREVRMNLLAEHTGVNDPGQLRKLCEIQGLVNQLNQIADTASSRLCHHPSVSDSKDEQWLESLLPDGLPLDPEGPMFQENAYENIAADKDGFFTRGIAWLSNLVAKKTE